MVLFLAGCHRPVYPVAPSVPPAESGIDLQLDAQTRSLQEAYRAYVQGRYSKASILFRRFVETNSRSPRLSEARWWLARSYEAQGNLQAAVAEYRTLAGASAPSNDAAAGYQAHAVRRLADIMQSGGAAVLSGVRPVVLSMPHAAWTRIVDLSSWIAQVRKAGVTTLLVDAGPSVGEPEESRAGGVYFKTSRVPVIDDVLGRVIPRAHAEGVAVFARLDLHQASWISPKPDSVSTAPSPTAMTPQPIGPVDVLDPAYQQAVSGIVDDLCRAGIDGLILQTRMRNGFAEEISPISRAAFERKFSQTVEKDPTSPFFWKWAGWKAHSYLSFAEQLKDQARREQATLIVAVTVHASAVLDPKAALMDYGEDLLESRLKGFEVVVLPESGGSNASESGRTELTKRLAPMIQGERPLWLGTPLTLSDPESIPVAISATLTAMSERPAIPLVLITETVVP
jgi:tetratricopeptide (TPR) repeat protein